MVVKVGTRVLVQPNGQPASTRLDAVVQQIHRARRSGIHVILVSSGAIGAGMQALNMKVRPTALPDLQMAAAVGQSRLMAHYDRLFGARGLHVGQVLLTHDGLLDRERHLNARNTIMCLLRNDVIPVVNENDAVAVDEIRFGDNDQLAALVTMLVDAELLVLLSSVNGLRAPLPGKPGRTRRISTLHQVTDNELRLAWGKGSTLSTGGMASKLAAAQAVVEVGGAVVIADGRRPDTLDRVLAGDDIGTLIGFPGKRHNSGSRISGKKRWIAFFQRAQGGLTVDDGAADAISCRGKSLLPVGIDEVVGTFGVGAMVNIRARSGRRIARGLVSYSHNDITQIKGRRSDEIATLLGSCPYREVIHRDNMLILDSYCRTKELA